MNRTHKRELIYIDFSIHGNLLCYFLFDSIKELNVKSLIKEDKKYKSLLDQATLKSATLIEGKSKIRFSNGLELDSTTILKNSTNFDVLKENKEIEKTLFSFLKAIRKKEKLTQEQLAKKSGLKQSAIARLEKGTNDIQLSTLMSYLKPMGYKLQITKE